MYIIPIDWDYAEPFMDINPEWMAQHHPIAFERRNRSPLLKYKAEAVT